MERGRIVTCNQGHVQLVKNVLALTETTTHCLIIDEASNNVFVHASSTAKTIIGPYVNEYMFPRHVVENGTRIKILDQCVDSFKAKEQNPRLRAAIAALKEEASA